MGLPAGKQARRRTCNEIPPFLPCWCIVRAEMCDPAEDDFCHNWSVALNPHSLLPATQFKVNATHPSPAEMNCGWVLHLQTIWFFSVCCCLSSSLPPPQFNFHFPVSLVLCLSWHFLRHTTPAQHKRTHKLKSGTLGQKQTHWHGNVHVAWCGERLRR